MFRSEKKTIKIGPGNSFKPLAWFVINLDFQKIVFCKLEVTCKDYRRKRQIFIHKKQLFEPICILVWALYMTTLCLNAVIVLFSRLSLWNTLSLLKLLSVCFTSKYPNIFYFSIKHLKFKNDHRYLLVIISYVTIIGRCYSCLGI